MHEDEIVEVGLNQEERLYVRFKRTDFIYREAIGVH